MIGRARTAIINYHDSPLPQQPNLQTTSWAWLNSKTQHAITRSEIVLGSDAARIFQQNVMRTITGAGESIGDITPVLDRSLIPMISQQNAAICQQEQALAIARSALSNIPSTSELAPFQHPYLSTNQVQTALQRYPIALTQHVEEKSLLVMFTAYCARLAPESEFDLW